MAHSGNGHRRRDARRHHAPFLAAAEHDPVLEAQSTVNVTCPDVMIKYDYLTNEGIPLPVNQRQADAILTLMENYRRTQVPDAKPGSKSRITDATLETTIMMKLFGADAPDVGTLHRLRRSGSQHLSARAADMAAREAMLKLIQRFGQVDSGSNALKYHQPGSSGAAAAPAVPAPEGLTFDPNLPLIVVVQQKNPTDPARNPRELLYFANVRNLNRAAKSKMREEGLVIVRAASWGENSGASRHLIKSALYLFTMANRGKEGFPQLSADHFRALLVMFFEHGLLPAAEELATKTRYYSPQNMALRSYYQDVPEVRNTIDPTKLTQTLDARPLPGVVPVVPVHDVPAAVAQLCGTSLGARAGCVVMLPELTRAEQDYIAQLTGTETPALTVEGLQNLHALMLTITTNPTGLSAPQLNTVMRAVMDALVKYTNEAVSQLEEQLKASRADASFSAAGAPSPLSESPSPHHSPRPDRKDAYRVSGAGADGFAPRAHSQSPHVFDDDTVGPGDVSFEDNPARYEADLAQLRVQIGAQQQDVQRLEAQLSEAALRSDATIQEKLAALRALDTELAQVKTQLAEALVVQGESGINLGMAYNANEGLMQRIGQLSGQIAELDRKLATEVQRHQETRAQVRKYWVLLLWTRGTIANLQLRQAQLLATKNSQLAQQQLRVVALEAELAELRLARQQALQQSGAAAGFVELTTLQRHMDAQAGELEAAHTRLQQLTAEHGTAMATLQSRLEHAEAQLVNLQQQHQQALLAKDLSAGELEARIATQAARITELETELMAARMGRPLRTDGAAGGSADSSHSVTPLSSTSASPHGSTHGSPRPVRAPAPRPRRVAETALPAAGDDVARQVALWVREMLRAVLPLLADLCTMLTHVNTFKPQYERTAFNGFNDWILTLLAQLHLQIDRTAGGINIIYTGGYAVPMTADVEAIKTHLQTIYTYFAKVLIPPMQMGREHTVVNVGYPDACCACMEGCSACIGYFWSRLCCRTHRRGYARIERDDAAVGAPGGAPKSGLHRLQENMERNPKKWMLLTATLGFGVALLLLKMTQHAAGGDVFVDRNITFTNNTNVYADRAMWGPNEQQCAAMGAAPPTPMGQDCTQPFLQNLWTLYHTMGLKAAVADAAGAMMVNFKAIANKCWTGIAPDGTFIETGLDLLFMQGKLQALVQFCNATGMGAQFQMLMADPRVQCMAFMHLANVINATIANDPAGARAAVEQAMASLECQALLAATGGNFTNPY